MTAIVGLVLVLSILVLIYKKLSRHPLDPVALFCYFFSFFYVLRETFITLGWDTPYPDFLFIPGQTSHLLIKAALALSLFLVVFAVSYVVVEPYAGSLARFMPACWYEPPVKRHIRLVAFLTIAATLVSIFLVGRYGGIGGMIRAGKKTGSLAGSYELRIFPAVGSILAAALTLTLWQRRHITGQRTPAIVAGLVALLNSGYVFLWGSRGAVGGVMVIFIAGQWMLTRGRKEPVHIEASERSRRPRVTMVIALVLIMVASVIGLRLFRDTVLAGHVNPSLQGQSRVRQLSVSTNSIRFDPFLLALRDWPSVHPFRGGQDFAIGAEGIVPRILWPGKPQNVRAGSWFRQVYEPTVTNGWPLGAVGDWYLNFGILGIIIGGALSGAFMSALSAAWWRSAWTPVTLASLTGVVFFVVPTGVDSLALLHWVQWALPLLVCVRYLDAPMRRRELSRVPSTTVVGQA